MHLDEELQHALAIAEQESSYSEPYSHLYSWNSNSSDTEQIYNWNNSGIEESNNRLPPVSTAFSFSRSFALPTSNVVNNNHRALHHTDGSYNEHSNYQYTDDFSNEYHDENTSLSFPALLTQSQLNIEQSRQIVNDFDLSLIR